MNPKWKVRPKIALKDSAMKFLTCTYPDGRDAGMMIHTCRWNHYLPSDQPDQI